MLCPGALQGAGDQSQYLSRRLRTFGERVFALVDRRMWYVLGNFRETLLPAIEPGMEARVNLVGYPGLTFHGVVQGIAWSVLSPSGQTTGLLPKIDPTLNWARLAQRIPVRIILDAPPTEPLSEWG